MILISLATINICRACECKKGLPAPQPANADANSIDAILKQLKQKTKELESYQCQIEYLFSQPLFESETLRKGDLYYQRFGKKTKLRINFQTLKQDDEKEQKYIEQYIIDGPQLANIDYKFVGIWLVHIDYQIKTVKCRQLAQPAEPNESADAFDLVSRNFPMIGFTQASDLQKEFEIKLVEPEQQAQAENLIQLRLNVKPDSNYKNDYTSIDFWIDKSLYLPAKIVAVSTEDDISQIRFIKPIVNKKLSETIFDFKIPNDFDKPEIIPLERKN
jgi:outer membrane lipoprotein-sorting protein